MEHSPLISVIVPVYNAEKYLRDCLKSITGQTYGNLEVILVDDGSGDGSSWLCDAFAQTDNRIQVIHQENTGAAGARKTGISHASGEYLCFVDADDVIDAGMMAFFAERMENCDLLTSGFISETSPGRYAVWIDSLEEGIYDTEEKRNHFLDNMITYENRFEVGLQPYLCGKLYRTELIRDVAGDIDPSIVYSEDRDLLFRYILKAGSMKISHQSFYHYRYNPDSIMRTVNKNFMSDLNKLYLSLEKAFAGHPREESLMHQLQMFLLSRMYLIPDFMGFGADIRMTGYVFPFSELEKGSRIILYGAGKVGTCYYRQIYRKKRLQLVLWADKNWRSYSGRGCPVFAPERMTEIPYDYIVIAVEGNGLAEEIRDELVSLGIAKRQILWRPPAVL